MAESGLHPACLLPSKTSFETCHCTGDDVPQLQATAYAIPATHIEHFGNLQANCNISAKKGSSGKGMRMCLCIHHNAKQVHADLRDQHDFCMHCKKLGSNKISGPLLPQLVMVNLLFKHSKSQARTTRTLAGAALLSGIHASSFTNKAAHEFTDVCQA